MNAIRRFNFAILFACLCCFAAAVQAGEFAQPRPGLRTGGQPTLEQLDALPAQGVRTVIDLRPDSEDHGYDEARELQQRKLKYLRLPIAGAQDLTPANATALKKLLDESSDGVLLHCASGNRAGALLALMAAQEERLPPAQALELGKQAGMKSLSPVVEEKLGLAPAVVKPTQP
ncbi:MAG TPA: sulfur transferase domain-containing protein [Pseudoxanthomonas sp.]|nr:sulfur transferase domain-containing protein [Pseudoxanthomonas sp.]